MTNMIVSQTNLISIDKKRDGFYRFCFVSLAKEFYLPIVNRLNCLSLFCMIAENDLTVFDVGHVNRKKLLIKIMLLEVTFTSFDPFIFEMMHRLAFSVHNQNKDLKNE